MSTFASPLLAAFDAGGLRIAFSDNAHDGVLDAFHEIHDRTFVLANEKEAYEGFSQCLTLNNAPHRHQQAQFGPFLEVFAVARLADSDAVVSGANFVLLSSRSCASLRSS